MSIPLPPQGHFLKYAPAQWPASFPRPPGGWKKRARVTVGSRLLIMTFLVIQIASIHVGLSLRVGSREVFPYFGAFLAGSMLILLCRGTIKLKSVMWLVSFFFLATLTTFGTYAIEGALHEGLDDRVRSLVALGAAMFAGYGLFLGIRALGRKKASKVFFYIWLFIIVFAFLEVYGGLRPLSDAVRAGLRPDAWLYELDLRDLGRYGAIRPKVFAAEPSIVGYTASLCLTGWFVLGLRERAGLRLMKFLVMVGITWFFVRSPAMATGVAAALLAYPFHVIGRRTLSGFREARAIFHPVLMVATVLAIILTAMVSTQLSRDLAGEFSFFSTGSFFIRQVAPYLAEIEVIKSHLLLGVGVGGDDLMFAIVEQVYVDNSAFIRFPELFDMPVDILITNAFYSYWHALGLLGGAAGALMLYYFGMSVRALPLFILAATAVGAHSIGGMNNPRVWTMFFLYTAVSSMVAPRFATLRLPASAPAYVPPPPAYRQQPVASAPAFVPVSSQ